VNALVVVPQALRRLDQLLVYGVIQQRGDSLYSKLDFGAVISGSRVLGQTAQKFSPSHNYRQLVIDPVNIFFPQHGFLLDNVRNYLACTLSILGKKFKQTSIFCSENGTNGQSERGFPKAFLPCFTSVKEIKTG